MLILIMLHVLFFSSFRSHNRSLLIFFPCPYTTDAWNYPLFRLWRQSSLPQLLRLQKDHPFLSSILALSFSEASTAELTYANWRWDDTDPSTLKDNSEDQNSSMSFVIHCFDHFPKVFSTPKPVFFYIL